MQFPPHKCGLFLSHNEHRDYYMKLAEWLKESPQQQISWESKEAEKRAIESDEIWVLQWYPETPVGFHCIAAPTIDELLQWANEIDA